MSNFDEKEKLILCMIKEDPELIGEFGVTEKDFSGLKNPAIFKLIKKGITSDIDIIDKLKKLPDIATYVTKEIDKIRMGVPMESEKKKLPGHIRDLRMERWRVIGKDILSRDYEPETTQEWIDEFETIQYQHENKGIYRLSEITAKPIQWFWQNYIAYGCLTLMAGEVAIGKSMLSLYLASCLSAGKAFPRDTNRGSATSIIFSTEDNLEYAIRPRMDAMGGDPDNIIVIQRSFKSLGEVIGTCRKLIKEEEKRKRSVQLIVFDPLAEFMGEKMNMDSYSDTRQRLSPLCLFLNEYNIACIGIQHLNKDESKKFYSHRVMGSTAFMAVARSCLAIFQKDEKGEPKNKRHMIPIMANLAPDSTSLVFNITGGTGYPTIDFDEMPSDLEVGDLGGDDEYKDRQYVRAGFKAWLKELLEIRPRTTKEVIEENKQALNVGEATIHRAKADLKIKSVYDKSKDKFFWVLPGQKLIKVRKSSKLIKSQ